MDLGPTFDALQQLTWSFRFAVNETPLSSPAFAGAVVTSYVLAVFVLKRIMRDRAPLSLLGFVRVHNMTLCVISFVLASLLAHRVGRFVREDGLHAAICSREMHEDTGVQVLYFFNYLTKMYEFVDTLFLILRKKPILFLHVYHHAATFLLTYVQQVHHSTVQWIPILLNLCVHVVMYYYYYLQASGVKRIPWKRWVTVFQIVQFVLDVAACVYAYSSIFFGYCHGTHFGAVSGIGILSSYLVLFLIFYRNAYKAKPKAA